MMRKTSKIALWRRVAAEVDNCPFCSQEKNKLQHILGGGEINRPDYFFVLINPTYRNISSHPDHRGLRIPFMGVSNFWRVLVEASFLPKSLYLTTERRLWDLRDIQKVHETLVENKIYLTNLVKCTEADATLPSKEKINWGLEILQEEIFIVNPEFIISFGQLPFKTLTGQSIKLNNHYREVQLGRLRFYGTKDISGKNYRVFPTYFPTGRGKPKECLEILKILKERLG